MSSIPNRRCTTTVIQNMPLFGRQFASSAEMRSLNLYSLVPRRMIAALINTLTIVGKFRFHGWCS